MTTFTDLHGRFEPPLPDWGPPHPGEPAHGYATSAGEPLTPEITVSNKTNIRREMAAALRAFGGATRLMDGRG